MLEAWNGGMSGGRCRASAKQGRAARDGRNLRINKWHQVRSSSALISSSIRRAFLSILARPAVRRMLPLAVLLFVFFMPRSINSEISEDRDRPSLVACSFSWRMISSGTLTLILTSFAPLKRLEFSTDVDYGEAGQRYINLDQVDI